MQLADKSGSKRKRKQPVRETGEETGDAILTAIEAYLVAKGVKQ